MNTLTTYPFRLPNEIINIIENYRRQNFKNRINEFEKLINPKMLFIREMIDECRSKKPMDFISNIMHYYVNSMNTLNLHDGVFVNELIIHFAKTDNHYSYNDTHQFFEVIDSPYEYWAKTTKEIVKKDNEDYNRILWCLLDYSDYPESDTTEESYDDEFIV